MIEDDKTNKIFTNLSWQGRSPLFPFSLEFTPFLPPNPPFPELLLSGSPKIHFPQVQHPNISLF